MILINDTFFPNHALEGATARDAPAVSSVQMTQLTLETVQWAGRNEVEGLLARGHEAYCHVPFDFVRWQVDLSRELKYFAFLQFDTYLSRESRSGVPSRHVRFRSEELKGVE